MDGHPSPSGSWTESRLQADSPSTSGLRQLTMTTYQTSGREELRTRTTWPSHLGRVRSIPKDSHSESGSMKRPDRSTRPVCPDGCHHYPGTLDTPLSP